jgi:hypothetical protein
MPINLVQASLKQIAKIPGVEVQSVDIKKCNNPTFSPDGTNLLAKKAPQPKACDKKGANQCPYGTGGMRNVQTPVNSSASGGTGGSGGTGSGGRVCATTLAAAAGFLGDRACAAFGSRFFLELVFGVDVSGEL